MLKSNFEIINNYIVITNFNTSNLKLLNEYVNCFENLNIIFNKIVILNDEIVFKVELIYKNRLYLRQALKFKKEQNIIVDLKDKIYEILKVFSQLNDELKTIHFKNLNEMKLLIEFNNYFNKDEYDSFLDYFEFPRNYSLKYNILSKKILMKKDSNPSYNLNILYTNNYYINQYLYKLFNSNLIFNPFSPIALKLTMYIIFKQCPDKLKRRLKKIEPTLQISNN